MKPKNTKGPWVIAKDNQTIKSDETYICRIRYPFSPIDENDEIAANARLIAAAPEMLEALERILDFVDSADNTAAYDVLHAIRVNALVAIGKARGES